MEICWQFLKDDDPQGCATCITEAEMWLAKPALNDTLRMEFHTLKCYWAFIAGHRAIAKEQGFIAAALFHKVGGKQKIGRRIFIVLAHMYYEDGDYPKALENYQQLLQIDLQFHSQNVFRMGNDHYNIGNSFWGLDDRDSCRHHYAKAMAYWLPDKELKNHQLRYIYEELGTYAWEEGDRVLALDYFNKAALYQLKEEQKDEADGMVENAKKQQGQGMMKDALASYENALAFRVENYGANHPNTVCMYSNIARTLIMMERQEESLASVQYALSLMVPEFDPLDDLENPKKISAVANYQHLMEALVLKFSLLMDRDDETSVRSCTELIELTLLVIDQLRVGTMSDDSKLYWTVQAREFMEDALAFYQKRFQKNGDPQHIEAALNIIEKSKNVLLHQAERKLDARSMPNVPAEVAEQERDLEKSISEMGRFVFLEEKKCQNQNVDKVELWKNELASLEAEHAQLVLRIEREFPDYHILKYNSSNIDLELLRGKIGEGRSLLSLFQGKNAYYFILIEAGKLEFVKDERVEGIASAVLTLRKEISDRSLSLNDPQGSYDRLVRNAEFLYQVVFGAFAHAPLPELVIMSDGVFQHLPFEILLTEHVESNDRNYSALPWLIKDHQVHYITSIGSWQKEAQNAGTELDYLGVAPNYSEGGDSLPALEFNGEEVGALMELLSGEGMVGAEATESNFKQKVQHAVVIHLAMHATLDDLEPLYSAFIFGDDEEEEDGRLSMDEIFYLDLNARLAVLSACRTGDGKMQQGEGIMSLARAFAFAGCPSILMSHWNCEDRATYNIITDFSRAMKKGLELPQALQQSKLNYLKTCGPVKAHPYYWASTALIGNEEAIQFSGPWFHNPWYWAVGVLLFLAFIFRSKIRDLL